ncbi:transport-associated ob type 2 [Lucifera butyrica]|uniref:Transport-associated ob type 2 n=1 Tax=Lucifera butyrica TaxID=1351585 RepID=A0A498RAQ9_9FIRM|nr:sn-glycerol-3-phosphate ABC transporter ATP-binding protein UgpC [Lucifera butyrica]VBB07372.1 transport-associated ob type 2 [Lucifera butyrica]
MASLQLKNICKKYPGNVTAVNNLNLDIPDREFVVLVGPSGCGKSTTLRMIAGLEEISAGELYIDGKLVNAVPPKDRDIAMVFQNYALYPHMSVYENMVFGLKMRKTPKEEMKRRAMEAAKILDIEHLLERKPRALSGGQRQRVALGRAMVREPKVFLLDEPLSNLDAKLRDQMRAEISKLHRNLAATFVYVTHDQREAMTMGTCIVVMKDGLVQQVDTPQRLYSNPCNLFVAGFIGSPQMNFVKAVLEKGDNNPELVFGRSRVRLPAGERNPAVLNGYQGREVILGIRPENIAVDEAAVVNNPGSVVNAYVEVAEHMGAETYLFMKVEGSNFIARVSPGTKAGPGNTIPVVLEQEKIYLFDKDTEKTIF